MVVHLAYPLLPVPLEGLIRYAAMNRVLTYDTFSAATLAISAGILSVFVNQSIRAMEGSLSDDSENGACAFFMASGIVFFVLFGVIVLLYALVNDRKLADLSPVLHVFQGVVFASSVIPVVSAVVAQRGFRLRASMI